MTQAALDLHKSLVVVDGHCDTAMAAVGVGMDEEPAPPRDILVRGAGHIDVPRLLEGGVSAQFFALFTNDRNVPVARDFTYRMLAAMDDAFERSASGGGSLRLATKAKDALEAKAAGRVAGYLAIEGGEAIGESLDDLRAFYSRGVRLMGLTWNRANAIARGVGAPPPGGLTPFGRKVVAEMERLGMIVDASHLSDEALEDLLTVAERPVVASHSNSREVLPHRRNLTDSLAERIARTGGLVGVTFAGVFVDSDPAKVSLSRILDHVDRLVSAVGDEHVGLGTDFEGFTAPYGLVMKDCTEMPRLTEGLLGRGYEPESVRRIMGGNWLRVMGDILG